MAALNKQNKINQNKKKQKIEEDCPICLEPLDETPDYEKHKLKCGHTFHKECIKEWITKKINILPSRNSIVLKGEMVHSDIAKEMQLAFLQQDNKSWQMMVDSVYHRTGFMIAGNMNIDWIVVNGVPHKFH